MKHYSIPNICQFIMFSNEEAAMRVAGSDRRMFCIKSNAQCLGDQGQVIWDWYHRGGFAAVAYYLGNLDLTGFSATQAPPMTKFKEDLIEASRPEVDLNIEGYMQDHPEFQVFSLRDLKSRLCEKYNMKQLGASLRRLDFRHYNSNSKRFWVRIGVSEEVIIAFKNGSAP